MRSTEDRQYCSCSLCSPMESVADETERPADYRKAQAAPPFCQGAENTGLWWGLPRVGELLPKHWLVCYLGRISQIGRAPCREGVGMRVAGGECGPTDG